MTTRRMTPDAAYDELVRRSRERSLLVSCIELAGWDELTYMPRGGVENRSRQMAYLAGLYHDAASDPREGELLGIVAASPLVADPLSAAAVNVRQWRRTFERMSRQPRALVEELARVTTAAQQAWAAARQDESFAEFRPWLEQVVRLVREQGECLRDAKDVGRISNPSERPVGGRIENPSYSTPNAASVYDALLQDYEPGASAEQLRQLFAALRPELAALLDRIRGAKQRTSNAVLRRDYPLDRQKIFGESVAAALGFDFDRGRLDTTTHPFFSPIGPGDSRITTRYRQNDFAEAFFGLLHELGHGLYEQGLGPEHYGTPLGESSSLGVHEALARLWENAVGRSLPFWRHFFPQAREVFHQALHDVDLDEFYTAVNHVRPSVNRVRADEATYDLHILVRFELEQALLSGELPPADLPAAWNENYRQHLGVTPTNDAEGCLQDGHWSAGQFGYFPTYTLGNVYAAQLFAAARAELTSLDEQFAAGDFAPFNAWLSERIYCHGQRYLAADLIEAASGQPLDHRPLIESMRAKYGELYRIAR
jgi:carboxypeptidase Taq